MSRLTVRAILGEVAARRKRNWPAHFVRAVSEPIVGCLRRDWVDQLRSRQLGTTWGGTSSESVCTAVCEACLSCKLGGYVRRDWVGHPRSRHI
eukprot:9467773-Pyramimonas_sp.AAC.2